MPLLLKLAVIFSLSVSVWAQSDSALARQSDSELAWHKEADNPVAAQFLQPFVPLDIDTYVLEPIGLSRVVYPLLLREQKIQGVVVALIVVSETGDVESFRIVKGDTVPWRFCGESSQTMEVQASQQRWQSGARDFKGYFQFRAPQRQSGPGRRCARDRSGH